MFISKDWRHLKVIQLFVLSLTLASILSLPSFCRPAQIKEKDTTCNIQNSIIFISDTQAPMWFEKIFVKTHRNEEATKVLFNAIDTDSTVSTVFFFGDVTAMGSFDHNWINIDSFLVRIDAKSISTYATAGNHDYLITSNSGEINFRKRFPDYCRTGYSVRRDSLAIILLNSNFGVLNDSEEIYQKEWYASELLTLEEDSTVKIVMVGCHHSPFSNSSIVGHSQRVRDEFVPPFTKSSKCKIFISGHAHTFQHFKDSVANKHFLVIGGGGGLLHKLKPGKSGELQDQVHWDSTYRMFHYVRATTINDTLSLQVMMLTEELKGPNPVYKIDIPLQ